MKACIRIAMKAGIIYLHFVNIIPLKRISSQIGAKKTM